MNVLTHNLNELLHTFLEVRMDVIHHTANRVIVQNQTSATSLLKNIENLFAVAEGIQECCGSTQVLAKTAKEKNVRVNTLQLVHNRTDYLYAVAHLYTHGMFNTHTQRVTVLHSTQVVQTVSQRQSLRISHTFANLLHTTVNVTQHRVDFANRLTLQVHAEVKHTVSRRVLRTNIHHIIVGTKNFVLHLIDRAILLQLIFIRHISQRLIRHVLRIKRIILLRVVILTERIAHPILAHKQAAHVRMVCKDNAIEVINLTLIHVSNIPKVANRGNHGVFAVFYHTLHTSLLMVFSILHLINHTDTLFHPVHTREVQQKVHALLIVQTLHFSMQVSSRNSFRFQFVYSRFRRSSGRACYCRTCCRFSGSSCRGSRFLCLRVLVCCRIQFFAHASSS